MKGRTLALLLILASPACAAETPPGTSLDIDATGIARVTPDELDATLSSQQSGGQPAALQQRVNSALAAALREAAKTVGVEPGLLGYDTTQDEKQRWTASGGIGLRSADSVRLLDLVGRLQASGLILDGLTWNLSPALHDRAETTATRAALTTLVRRANEAAAALGLRVASLVEVRVNDIREIQPRPMMAMRAMAAVPPPAPAAPLSVDVSASATVLLRP